jgi:hypothetical protein
MAFDMETDEEKRRKKLALIRRQNQSKIFNKESMAASPLAKALGGKSSASSADKAQAGLGMLQSGSAAEGAVAGSALGPMGMIGGAALGLAKGMAAQSRKKRELKAQSIKEQGENIKQTASEKNKALKSIMEGLRAAFLGI